MEEKLSQKALCIRWIEEHGYILPAKMAGKIYYDTMFGSESSKRCRELRDKFILDSAPFPDNPKFEMFYKRGQPPAFLHKPQEIAQPVFNTQLYSPSYIRMKEEQRQGKLI